MAENAAGEPSIDRPALRHSAHSPRPRRSLRRRLLVLGITALLLGSLAVAITWELGTSALQSLWISRFVEGLEHWVDEGPNPALRFPQPGPYDRRFGYSELPAIQQRLGQRGFKVAAQARVSPQFEKLLGAGLFPIYSEKPQAGLRIVGRDGVDLFSHSSPDRIWTSFEDVPAPFVAALLHVENRELLDADRPYLNPAVEWDRLAVASERLALRWLGDDASVPGASTLATQLEKFRHSVGGITATPKDKLRQMASASMRAYLDGRDSLDRRRRIVVDYLNGIPLGAIARYGEVHGLIDGLRLWYGIDPHSFQALREPLAPERLPEAGRVYRAGISLILASRRPGHYLSRAQGGEDLRRLTDSYLGILRADGIIPAELAKAALHANIELRYAASSQSHPFVERKAANAIRADLVSLTGSDGLYALDRLDLTVVSSIDGIAQRDITNELDELRTHRRAASGLAGPRLLPANGDLPVTYSFLLYESTPAGNVVRVHADTLEGPLDVNRNTKLELGSTAKLRTLITYLETIEALHETLAGSTAERRVRYLNEHRDPLTRWAADLLEREPQLPLDDMLSAGMGRRYSASPSERFFTGGGVHQFSNYDRTFDGRRLTVEEGFRHSVNLVFIRIMHDVVQYHIERLPSAGVLRDRSHPQRVDYLARFADHEGQEFITRFYRKHSGKTPAESIELIFGKHTPTTERLARVYRAVLPSSPIEALAAFAASRLPNPPLLASELEQLYRDTAPDGFHLADLGYLAGTHPLELWVAHQLADNPEVSLSQTIAASAEARQDAYRWLFRTRSAARQDERIRIIVEAEAFAAIHQSWQRLGYPFAWLVPSLATGIGSSGDSPQALAELAGILVNDGIRRPVVNIEELRFAEDTPFETRFQHEAGVGTAVLSTEVARIARRALEGVVETGTARRLKGVFLSPDGAPLVVGGKTGTGDNRFTVVGPTGAHVASRSRSRTATLIFFIGNRFGAVTAYVEGSESKDFDFTSALPVQILRHLAPTLTPLLHDRDANVT